MPQTQRADKDNWIAAQALAAETAAVAARRQQEEETAAAQQAAAVAQREAEALVVASRLTGWLGRPVLLGRDLAVGEHGYAQLGDVALLPDTVASESGLRLGWVCPSCQGVEWGNGGQGIPVADLARLGAALRAMARMARYCEHCWEDQRAAKPHDENRPSPRIEASWVEVAPAVWVRASAVTAVDGSIYTAEGWPTTIRLSGMGREDYLGSPHPVDVLRRALREAEG